jgi:hypothetical protein
MAILPSPSKRSNTRSGLLRAALAIALESRQLAPGDRHPHELLGFHQIAAALSSAVVEPSQTLLHSCWREFIHLRVPVGGGEVVGEQLLDRRAALLGRVLFSADIPHRSSNYRVYAHTP